MRVGEVAARAGVNIETLRYYERRGLLPSPDRDHGGHRRYDEGTVALLNAIKEAQALGFTLAEIEDHLRTTKRASSPADAVRARVAAKIDEIDGRIAALQGMRDELARVARRVRAPDDHPTLVHVTNGDSTAETLRGTSLDGNVISWQDVLHEGPVPDVPRPELLRTRARFLAGCGWGSEEALHATLERRDREFLDALHEGAHVVLWFEHDLYDQLQLIDALALVEGADALPDLIVVGAFEGRPGFRGLGELAAPELETLWPRRLPASPEQVAEATAAWAAVRAPDPRALASLRVEHLPFLAAALRRLLEELPSPRDGLSTTERHALTAIDRGATTAVEAFVAAQDLEEAPFLGDSWFFRTLDELRAGGLVTDEPLALTEDGRRVLAGALDRVELLGVDRWVGGTHLTRDSWRWDPESRALRG